MVVLGACLLRHAKYVSGLPGGYTTCDDASVIFLDSQSSGCDQASSFILSERAAHYHARVPHGLVVFNLCDGNFLALEARVRAGKLLDGPRTLCYRLLQEQATSHVALRAQAPCVLSESLDLLGGHSQCG